MTTQNELAKKADCAVEKIRRFQQVFEIDIKKWTIFRTKDPRKFKKEIKQHAQRLIKCANTIK